MDTLHDRWYQDRPFNRNSVFLYDFFVNNNLAVADFLNDQDVNYTYMNGSDKTYIDHILIPEYVSDMIKECKILSNNVDNISDHFAIHLSLDVPQYKQNVDPHKPVQRLYAPSTPGRPKWDDEEYRKEHVRELDKALSRVELQEVNAIQCNPEKYNI